MAPTYVKIISYEPTNTPYLWPTPSVRDSEEITNVLKDVDTIENIEDLTKAPYPIVSTYRNTIMWVAPNICFYRHKPLRGSINQYTCSPYWADCEEVKLNIDGVMYDVNIEFNCQDALVTI
jgi:hypothetical protein